MTEHSAIVKLTEIQKQIDDLTLEAKVLKPLAKLELDEAGTTTAYANGYEVVLATTNRQTVKKADFVNHLILNNLTDLIYTQQEPNMALIDDAVKQGRLAQTDYDTYVKVSTSEALKVKQIKPAKA